MIRCEDDGQWREDSDRDRERGPEMAPFRGGPGGGGVVGGGERDFRRFVLIHLKCFYLLVCLLRGRHCNVLLCFLPHLLTRFDDNRDKEWRDDRRRFDERDFRDDRDPKR